MTQTFMPPSHEIMELWRKGDAITDKQLADLERFFAAMVVGAEALGPRFDLATNALRQEWYRAEQIQRYRKM